MPTRLGDQTKSVFVKGVHGNDIHHEFEAGAAIEIGQPVKLDTDGTVVPAAADDPLTQVIGTSIMSRETGELITIATRWRCVIYGRSTGAANAGPAAYKGYADEYSDFAAPTTESTQTVGHIITPATADNEEIEVGLL